MTASVRVVSRALLSFFFITQMISGAEKSALPYRASEHFAAISSSVSGSGRNSTFAVLAATLSAITVSPTNPTVGVGGTQAFTALGTYSDGSTQDLTATVTWASSNSTAVTISTAGVATGVTSGTSATITAAMGTVSGATMLSVVSGPVSHIDFNYPDRNTLLGAGWSFIATVAAGGTRNTEVASGSPTVDYNQTTHPGMIRLQLGSGEIYGTSNNSQNTLFRALPANWTSIRLRIAAFNPTSNYQQVGLLLYQDDDNYLNVACGYANSVMIETFTERAATVTYVNRLSVTSIGNLIIRLDQTSANNFTSYYSADGGATWRQIGSKSLTLNNPRLGIQVGTDKTGTFPAVDLAWVETLMPGPPPTLNAITVTPANPSVVAGNTIPLTATGTYSDGSTQNITSTVTWSSSNPSVATITAAGVATGVAAGSSATITAPSGAISGSTTLMVTPPPPISVTVAPASSTVPSNSMQTFTATVQNDPLNMGVSWSLTGSGCIGAACGTLTSSAMSVVYTAPSVVPNPPTVSVIATSVADNTKSATAQVTVGPPLPIVVTVNPGTATVSLNLTRQFNATAQNDGSNLGVTWSLAGTGCSGANCGTLGSATATSIIYTAPASVPTPATVTITATSVADSTKIGTATVTVSQGIPTSLGWYQIPNTQLAPICPKIMSIQGTIGCQGVISAWSGGIADTKRNRLLFWGGGHQNYWGNEVYALNLTDLTLTQVTQPTVPPVQGCVEQWSTTPAAPAARESYSDLAYLSDLDAMWVFGGALATSGCRSSGMWMLDLPSLTWTRKDPTSGAQLTSYTDINYTEYDPVTKQVYYYVSNAGIFASYAPQTNTVTVLLQGGSYGVPAYSNGVIDPVRRKMVILGAGYAASFDLATGAFSNFSSLTTNCTGIQNPSYPGLAYDPVQDRIVGWAGGNTVYLFDLPSKTCTSVTYPGGPPAQQTNGTYGRWRYFQSLNVFALVNDWKQNAYTLRLTPAP